MRIVLNGELAEISALTLDGLLEEQGFDACVATAVNEDFVPAPERGTLVLKEGDRIEVLAPMQGG
ncbi:sulfur carrier protein ThiS [Roseibium sp. RKSG952]|uniref:sulfur carrier protein ThiS n=1 Tax=Roseibium sp. RKSG952 TaxID=2529384 RepID=UPI0012BBD91B|nr:sulfur carrier protein ThiS [Roseibium sp. RKSG952]MTH96286.1 sulfur carrier protein ThiS [Roseibium sp. RKSG952]